MYKIFNKCVKLTNERKTKTLIQLLLLCFSAPPLCLFLFVFCEMSHFSKKTTTRKQPRRGIKKRKKEKDKSSPPPPPPHCFISRLLPRFSSYPISPKNTKMKHMLERKPASCTLGGNGRRCPTGGGAGEPGRRRRRPDFTASPPLK